MGQPHGIQFDSAWQLSWFQSNPYCLHENGSNLVITEGRMDGWRVLSGSLSEGKGWAGCCVVRGIN